MTARSSPAALRNREPIAEVLAGELPESGMILMIAEGTGEHAAYFARRFPRLNWQPTDLDPQALGSIETHREEARLANLHPPLALDACAPEWPVERAEAVICINMIHISPWRAAEGLVASAARVLPQDGLLYLYGPYRREGLPLEPSNAAFDESLKRRDPEWGLRDLGAVARLAARKGLRLDRVTEMPANNLSLLFRRT